tara:strand:- start:59 stop:214 length:156 start_codon:yes stop_codon:yes gene_type:complete
MKVIVGAEKIVFLVQKGIIVTESDFFKVVCNDRVSVSRASFQFPVPRLMYR